MMRRTPVVVAAGTRFARSGHPDDELFVIIFNERVSYGLASGTPFTSDREELHRALQRVTARGQTALFDALRESLRHLAHGTRQKKVLVVLSDGGDNASSATFDDVLGAALRMDAVIYTVSIHDPYDSEGNPRLLRKLADATGGVAFSSAHPKSFPGSWTASRATSGAATRSGTCRIAPRAREDTAVTVRLASAGRG